MKLTISINMSVECEEILVNNTSPIIIDINTDNMTLGNLSSLGKTIIHHATKSIIDEQKKQIKILKEMLKK